MRSKEPLGRSTTRQTRESLICDCGEKGWMRAFPVRRGSAVMDMSTMFPVLVSCAVEPRIWVVAETTQLPVVCANNRRVLCCKGAETVWLGSAHSRWLFAKVNDTRGETGGASYGLALVLEGREGRSLRGKTSPCSSSSSSIRYMLNMIAGFVQVQRVPTTDSMRAFYDNRKAISDVIHKCALFISRMQYERVNALSTN